MNIKLTLSYCGDKFSGYQVQPNAITVQETINQAWRVLTGETVVLYGCSRLDAGVHARYFVLHFQSQTNLNEEKIIRALNGIFQNQLKSQISIYNCEFVDDNFHARYHAIGKHYRYLIWQGYKTNALLTSQCWHIHSKNKLENLTNIFSQYIGKHDFAGFRASDCSAKQTVKHIHAVHVSRHHEFPEMITLDFFGDGFLKNMIRNMVGTGVQMSLGKLNEACIQEAFLHKNRLQIGMCAPSWALTLMKVYYNNQEFLADSQACNKGEI